MMSEAEIEDVRKWHTHHCGDMHQVVGGCETLRLLATLDAARRENAALRERLAEAYQYAKSLSESMAKAWPAVEGWKPLDSLAGVISQIDNMASGFIARTSAAEARVRELEGKDAL
jgi:hypothetical protein